MADVIPPPPPGAEDYAPISSAIPPPPPGAVDYGPVQAEPPQSFWSKLTSNPLPQEDESFMPEVSKNVAAITKDIGLGAAEDVTGAGELIPGLAPYAARGSQYLKSNVTYPAAEIAGRALPIIFGAGPLGGMRAVDAGAEYLFPALKTLKKASGFLPAAGRAALEAGKGVALGAGTGLLAPTGEEDPSERARKKLQGAEFGALTGGLVGGGLGALGEGAMGLKNYLTAEAKEGSEALRGQIAGEVGGVRAKAGAEKDIAEAADPKLYGELQARQATLSELNQIKTIQKNLGFHGLAQDMPERVTNTEHLARQSGLSPQEARTFAVEQEAKTTEAEHAANQLAQEIDNGMDIKAFDEKLQTTIDDVHEKYVKVREKESGYEDAMKQDGELPVGSESIGAYIDKNLKKVSGLSTARPFLISVKRDLENGLTINNADSLRKGIDKVIRTNRIQYENGQSAPAGEALHYAHKVRSLLLDEMRETSPAWGKAFDNFKKFSRPLDMFERGPLAGLAKTDPLSGEYKVLSGDVLGRVLQKTKKGANALAFLVRENPELKQDAFDFFRRQLYGPDGLEEKVTPTRIVKFLKEFSPALKQTGLFEHFMDVKQTVESIEEAEKALAAMRERDAESLKESLAAMRERAAGGVEEAKKALAAMRERGAIAKEVFDTYDVFDSQLKSGHLLPENVPMAVEPIATALKKGGYITKEMYDDFLEKITSNKEQYKTAARRMTWAKHITALFILGAPWTYEGYRLLWTAPLGQHGH